VCRSEERKRLCQSGLDRRRAPAPGGAVDALGRRSAWDGSAPPRCSREWYEPNETSVPAEYGVGGGQKGRRSKEGRGTEGC
jgi:hypothetical protein